MTGTPVAGLIVVRPGVQIKPVECDALLADGDLGDVWPDLAVEAVAVHAEVSRGIAQTKEARKQGEPRRRPSRRAVLPRPLLVESVLPHWPSYRDPVRSIEIRVRDQRVGLFFGLTDCFHYLLLRRAKY